MQSEFWYERWQNKQIGFHKDVPNAYLTSYWQDLGARNDCHVFVPLCGKSLDMIWLAAQGHQIVGVELSQIAVSEFFEAAGIEPKVSDMDGFSLFETPQIKIFCGDIFSIRSKHLENVQAVYDRGSLVALPREMRVKYIAHLRSVLPTAIKGLLVAMEYDQDIMPGPPFAVEAAEIRDLFDGFEDVDTLAFEDIEFRDRRVRMRIWKYLRR